MTNPMTRPEYPSNSVIRRTHAERQVRRKYEALNTKLLADMQRELDEIDRQFWNGEFDEALEDAQRKSRRIAA